MAKPKDPIETVNSAPDAEQEATPPAASSRTREPEVTPLGRFSGILLLAGIFYLVGAGVIYGTFDRFTAYFWGFLAFGVVCGVFGLVGRSQLERLPLDSYSRQRALLGINATSSVALLFAILLGVNYVAARHHKLLDLTKNRLNTLSDQTVKTLDGLPSNVELTCYATSQPDPSSWALLQAYQRASDKVSIKFVSATKDPSSVPTTFNGQPLLEVQLQSSSNAAKTKQEVNVFDEQNITSALIKLEHPQSPVLYFLSGHGELGPDDLQMAKNALQAQNYQLKTFSLLTAASRVPADAAAILIVAPQVDLAPAELKVLKPYLAGGGKAVILFSPARVPLPNWTALAQSEGMTLGTGDVFDYQQSLQSPEIPVGVRGDVTRHPILRGVSADCIFPGAVAMKTIAPMPAGVNDSTVFSTSAQSVEMTSDGRQVDSGPFVLLGTAEAEAGRVVIGANATFVTDNLLPRYGDQSLFLSCVNWAVGDASLVSIPPKPAPNDTISLPTPVLRFADIYSVFILPALLLAVGGLVWFKRR